MTKLKHISSETKRFISYAVVILIVFTLVFWGFAFALEEHSLHSFDLAIITWVQSFISPKLTSIMEAFTFIGSTKGVISISVITIIIMLANKKWWETIFFTIAIIGSILFNSLLKEIFKRARPTIHPLVTETGYSFPSGHSMVSIVLYGMIMVFLVLFFKHQLTKVMIIIVLFFLILFIGISRIYLGVHYPSDVIAGFTAGGTWLIVCLIFLKLIVNNRN